MRSTYSLNRAEQWPGRLTFPIPVPRAAFLFTALFLVGVAFGWVATRPFVGSAPRLATTNDYVAVVAQLYARDHNLSLARERLALFGSPADLVSRAASDSHPRQNADVAAIQTLNQDLSGSGASASIAASSVKAQGSSSWTGPLIAFILAFVLGAIVLLRTAGLPLPSLRLPTRPTRPTPTDGTFARPAAPPTAPVAVAPARRAPRAAVLAEPEVELAPVVAPAAPARRTEVARPAARPRPRARLLTFESSYRLGDDPYDEIHPIIDPVSGALIAACGLNASLKIERGTDNAPSGYYAFAAWMQDYVNGETLNAVGLVTGGALQTDRASVESWVERGQIDSVVVADPGTTTELLASDLRAKVSVVEAGVVETEAGAYFDSLTIRFEVVPSAPTAEA